jgi:hypothetical protein
MMYRLSAVLCIVNLFCLIICIASDNVPGMIINGAFLLVNTAGAVSNLRLREQRIQSRREK